MVGLLIVLVIIAGVVVTVATLITLVKYAMFLSQAIQVASWGPDWLNGGGFAWIGTLVTINGLALSRTSNND